MAVDQKALMSQDKGTLVKTLMQVAGRAKKYKEEAKVKAQETMQVGFAAGTAFGLGFYLGREERDFRDSLEAGLSEEDAQALMEEEGVGRIMGIDTDLLAGIGLTAGGMFGVGGKKMSEPLRYMGIGALSMWAGEYGRSKGMEAKDSSDS